MKLERPSFAFVFLFSLCLLYPAKTQDRPQLSDQEEGIKDKDPPSTLSSGEEREIQITKKDPVLEESGHYKTFRFGALSEGPVTVEVKGEGIKWMIRVTDEKGKVIGEAAGCPEMPSQSLTVNIKAGQEFFVTVGTQNPMEEGDLKLTLTEKNRSEAEWEIYNAVKKARDLLSKSEEEKKAKNFERARTLTREAFSVIDYVPGGIQSKRAMDFLWNVGVSASELNDPETSLLAWTKVNSFSEAILAADHPDLQNVRMHLAIALEKLGHSEKARFLSEKVLDVFERTQSQQSPSLQRARVNLAAILSTLGNFQRARALLEKVLHVYESTLPKEDPDLQLTRMNLAIALGELGYPEKARSILEQVLAVYESILPQEHPNFQIARMSLATILGKLGDLITAKKLLEKVIELQERTLPQGHPNLFDAKLNLANTLMNLGNFKEARSILEEVLDVYERILPQENSKLLAARRSLAVMHKLLGNLKEARSILEKALAVYETILPKEHPTLQEARLDLAGTYGALGYFEEERSLIKKVLDIYENSLPREHPSLLSAQMDLASSLYRAGFYEKGKFLCEEIIEIRERTLSQEHPDLLKARVGLAIFLIGLGYVEKAQSILEKAIDVYKNTLPQEHPDLLHAQMALAVTFHHLGCFEKAKSLYKELIEIRERILSQEHPDVLADRINLAITQMELCDYEEARSVLEKAIEVYERTVTQNHPGLLFAQKNLAIALMKLGDLEKARSIHEKVLDSMEHTFHPDHPNLQWERVHLANILRAMGSFEKARSIHEKVVSVFERTLPQDHPRSLDAKLNLARTLTVLGDLNAAKTLYERILEVQERSLPQEHPDIFRSRIGLAITLHGLGDLEKARSLLKKTIELYDPHLPQEHRSLLSAKMSLGIILTALGKFSDAQKILREVFDVNKRILLQHSLPLQKSRLSLADSLIPLGKVKEAKKFIEKGMSGASEFILRRVQSGALGEIEESVGGFRWILDRYLSFGLKGHFTDKSSFLAAETFQACGVKAGLSRRCLAKHGGEEIKKLQKELTRASLKVASANDKDFLEAVKARDKVESALAEAVEKMPQAKEAWGSEDPEKIADAMPVGWAGISFLRYNLREWPKKEGESVKVTPSYLAFVLHKEGTVDRVELGPSEIIDEAVRLWREELCKAGAGKGWKEIIRKTGDRVRQLVWDPVQKKLGNVEKLMVAPDSLLATIPLEALPLDKGVLAERYTIAYMGSLSLQGIWAKEVSTEKDTLVAFGGVDYDAAPQLYKGEASAIGERDSKDERARLAGGLCFRSPPRGDGDDKVPPLPGTRKEIETLSELYCKSFGEKAILVKGAKSSKATFVSFAPKAGYLHVATHGYFAPESVRSIMDKERGVEEGHFSTFEEKVKGLAPSLLSGLKLAGCNLPREGLEDKGVITAEEIRGLDLSGCKLAVLSACETNVGLIRTGQGIMSLQHALKIAGAKGSVTSLWRVDDEATRVFFKEFYSHLWKEKMSSVEALWRVKLDMLHGKILPLAEGRERGAGAPTKREKLQDYTHPFFWSSFVYWGEVE